MHWKNLETKTILKTKFFSVEKEKFQKQDGTIVDDYYRIIRPEAAVVVAFTENNELIMVNQYRPPIREIDLEVPAGYMEEYDKDLKETAMRELLEETGYKVKDLKKIGENYASVGFLKNKIHFFLGFNAKKIKEPELDKNEEMELKIIAWKEVLKLVKKGEIKDIGSLTAILLAKEELTNK